MQRRGRPRARRHGGREVTRAGWLAVAGVLFVSAWMCVLRGARDSAFVLGHLSLALGFGVWVSREATKP